MITAHVGIDGGGTKTRACFLDSLCNKIYEVQGGPSAIDTVGIEGSVAEIKKIISSVAGQYQIKSIFCGLGGVAGEHHEKTLIQLIAKLPHVSSDAYIGVKNDVSAALLSKDGTLEGMALVLGTGSVAYGVHNRVEARVGGYHFMEGDPGSAYDFGWNATRHLAKVLDGRCQESDFSEELSIAMGVHSFSEMATYFSTWNRSKVALLAQIVTKYANTNSDAYDILQKASVEVGLMVKTLYERLKFDGTQIVLVGGLANAETPYKKMIHDKIREISPKIEIVSPQFSPAHAAALYGLNCSLDK